MDHLPSASRRGFISGAAVAVATAHASGAATRLNIADLGGAGDGTTDDYAAFDRALTALGPDGGTIFIPAGTYRLSRPLVFDRGVHLFGERRGRNPGQVGSTTYPYPSLFFGSTLYFDPGVSGILLLGHTSRTEPADVNGLSDSQKYDHSGATWSVIENLNILSAGQGAASEHGVEIRTMVVVRNVYVRNFGGDGIRVSATLMGSHGTSVYGNANQTILENCHCDHNRGNGFYITGRDANIIQLLSCNGTSNSIWGFDDHSLLGNTYVNCHASNNAAGSFRSSGGAAPSIYVGCYIEQLGGYKTSLTDKCIVIGGIMASPIYHPKDSRAHVISAGIAVRKGYSGLNDLGDVDVSATLGRDPSRSAGNIAFSFGSEDDTSNMDSFRLTYKPNGLAGWWGLTYANASTSIQFPTTAAGARAHAPSFPQGVFLGSAGSGPRLSHASAMPDRGDYRQGDFVFNAKPNITAGRILIGWSRLTNGSGHIPEQDWAACYAST